MQFVTFALLGLGVGSIYGIAAQGLVLVYRGSGILNFAQSGFLMIGAFIFYELEVNNGWPFFPALVATMASCAAMGALVHLVVLRPMRRASAISRLIATLGVLGVLSSIAAIIYNGQTYSVPSSLPISSLQVLPNLYIGWNIAILFLIGVGVTAVLWTFYRFTSFGRVTSAVAENQLAAAVTGHSPDVVAAVNWALGAALAGLAGVLIAPIDYIQSGTLILLIIPAIGAGLAGTFLSFPLALVGGLVLGATQSVISLYVHAPGWSLSIPYLLIILYLVIRGRAIPLRSFVVDQLPRVGTGRIRPPVVLALAVAMGLILALVPVEWATALTVTLAFSIITLSVVVITGYAGQLSLAQFVLAGVGALIAARLSANWHFPFLLALLGALVVTAVAGVVLAVPSLRARGISLAVATLAAGMVLFNVVLNDDKLSGGQNGVTERTPNVFGWSLDPSVHPARYGIATLIALVILSLAVANVRRGAAGRRMLAVRSNERAASALGVNVYGAKVYAFTVAAGIAGVGGMLFAFLSPVVTASSFDLLSSINIVTVTVAGGVGNVPGAPIGATMLPGGVVSQIFFGLQNINAWIPLAGSVLLLVLLRRHSSGIFELNREQLARLGNRLRRNRAVASGPADAVSTPPVMTAPVTPKTLRVENLRVAFGGVVAVNGVSITVRPGQVHSLIGPNGAGKTTFIDAVTGFVTPSGGRIMLDDVDVTRMRARRRAELGITRTFQSLELFDDLSVRENLAVASDPGHLRRYLTDLVHPGPAAVPSTVMDALRTAHLEHALDLTPDALPFGRRRLIAIMRALAAEPSVLLLDEPAAGLSDDETAELGTLIRGLATSRNIAVLLVEHNLDIVSAVSDSTTVLSAGGILAEGTPSEVLAHPAVLESYVGELVA